uniref:Mitochondrial carrier protein n=1 Tax=Pseudo-nitzschia australis TaxID=44445 RepID=A0A7S4EQI5_9STRA|mmetsp:Transcript_26962/g.59261  ORF Transcript_26962/g.59261 Transcript_26962/m.59261 type:complete len:271 (-) Transcript_26962:192-1004(-)|eukprot:CAMPEP_0168192996 /NCGR_PEP_ID=MMETSP0139_2-20121125/18352_1 /TAXON_ID=44445 /ORGANISM="Pseudo-nitzschia australis, Strain 10249 10 AB" /LENGTH=270 /DNA_ID=CAMNT_0008116285 /DNA_START=109 /DNA_END=921 /DNA_ORIENTATION=+
MSRELNESQNASVGMTVGMIEVLILQPFNYAKNMVQQQRPISMSPAVMYRGVVPNCINMGSCTMIQFVVGGKLKNIVSGGNDNHKFSLQEEMKCGIVAGSISALVGSPLELIMIQQQRKGGSGPTRVAEIAKNPVNFSRGLLGMAVREALWTCGYLSIPPVVRRTLMENYPTTFDTNDKARIPAALLGGLFGCYMTHPFDTIKTCMQGDIERKVYGNFLQTSRVINTESGITGFYRGATFRYGRMVCAVFIMDLLREKIGRLMYPGAFKD